MNSLRSKAVITAIKKAGLISTPITAENLTEKRAQFVKLQKFFRKLRSVKIQRVEDENFRGEWLVPNKSRSENVLLYIHGGGFVFNGTKVYRGLIGRLATEVGTRAFSLDYSLAPEYPYPKALHEAVAAYKWLLAQGIEPGSIALAGDSAGGGLALSLLHQLKNEQLPMPACAVVLSPATDATLTDASIESNKGKDVYINPEALKFFINSYFGNTSRTDPVASPLLGSLAGFPPLLIHVDKNEVMYSDSARLAEKATKAGVDTTLDVSDGLFHVWHLFADYMPEARKSVKEIGKFIKSRLPRR